jgi:hypothetical protein
VPKTDDNLPIFAADTDYVQHVLTRPLGMRALFKSMDMIFLSKLQSHRTQSKTTSNQGAVRVDCKEREERGDTGESGRNRCSDSPNGISADAFARVGEAMFMSYGPTVWQNNHAEPKEGVQLASIDADDEDDGYVLVGYNDV